jgi:Gpi18-like mannosyltransferase
MKFVKVRSRIQFFWLRFRPVVGIFVFSQIVFVISVWLGWRILPAAYPSVSADDQEFGLFVSSHFRWDAVHYLTIAREGYQASLDQVIDKSAAFFPLFPLSIKLTARLFGYSSIRAFAWVMIVMNNLICLGAFILIYNLAEEAGLDPPTARRAVLYLAIFPFAIFLAVPYTEALFLLLSAAFFLLLFKKKWVCAGVLAGLLSDTRLPGILFSILLITKFFFSAKNNAITIKESIRGVIAVVLSLSGLALYIVYLQVSFGDPYLFLRAHPHWNTILQFPFLTLWRGLVYVFSPSRTEFLDQYLINTLHTIFVVLFIVVMFASLRRWNWLYQLYAWLLFAVSLSFPLQGSATMEATGRYMMVIFPVYFTLAEWGKKAWMRMTIFAVWLLLYSLLSALYGRGYFIG